MHRLQRKTKPIYPLIFGIILIIIANWALLSSKYVLKWDGFDWLWPYFRWMGSALRDGYFPDFFPNLLSGYPMGSNIQAGPYNLLYLTIAFVFPDSVLSINVVYIILQIGIFITGFFIGRSFLLPSVSCIYLGLALVASGFVTGHASHIPFLSTYCGLLGIFLSMRLAVIGAPKISAAIAIIATYQLLTAGYPSNIIFGGQCLAGYWIYLFFAKPQHRSQLLLNFGALILGALICLPALLHFLNLATLSARGDGINPLAAMQNSLPLYSILNFFYPTWSMGFFEVTMERFHLLMISFPLIVIALALKSNKKNDYQLWILLLIALAMLWLSLGGNGPLPIRLWLAEHFYLYRLGRHPSGEHSGIALFLLALLSAIGLSRLCKKWNYLTIPFLLIISIDFLFVMHKLEWIRFNATPEKYQQVVPKFKTTYLSKDQSLIDAPRDCSGAGQDVSATSIAIERDRLAPNSFYWDAFEGLRDRKYDLERALAQKMICGNSRLWLLEKQTPAKYILKKYTPNFIELEIASDSNQPNEYVWAELTDGYWSLSINGVESKLETGLASLRTFTAKNGDIIKMRYKAPLSKYWRE
jgi:hypothetical protein